MHRPIDLSHHVELYKRPKSPGFLLSPSDGAMQKSWSSNKNKRAIYEVDEELNRLLHVYPIRQAS